MRVHQELFKRQKLPHVTKRIWDERLADIANFEVWSKLCLDLAYPKVDVKKEKE